MIVLLDYGAGNTQSVVNAMQRLGVNVQLSNDPDEIYAASKVIFPGVGAAGFAMDSLVKNELTDVVRCLHQPVLGICLGMHLMCNASEENQTLCLGIFDTSVTQFPPKLRVPHTGWNNLSNANGLLFKRISADANFYFVHSFAAGIIAETAAVCDYIFPFSAALERDNFFAVQFHPEKSGEAGDQLLKNFISL